MNETNAKNDNNARAPARLLPEQRAAMDVIGQVMEGGWSQALDQCPHAIPLLRSYLDMVPHPRSRAVEALWAAVESALSIGIDASALSDNPHDERAEIEYDTWERRLSAADCLIFFFGREALAELGCPLEGK